MSSLQIPVMAAKDPMNGPDVMLDFMDYVGIPKVCTRLWQFVYHAGLSAVCSFDVQASLVGINAGAILSCIFAIRFPGLTRGCTCNNI